jgi:hypothetical protein
MKISHPTHEPEQSTDSKPADAVGDASVQLKGKTLGEQRASLAPGGQSYASQHASLQPVQMQGGGDRAGVHSAAAHGTEGSGGAMPFMSQLQQSFGRHDVGAVQAYTGSAASQANAAIGSEAYATGNKVAFGSSPSLHTVAHEAAHVVQQRSGVSLNGGVGQAGDRYEQHADSVADAVVSGRSAEPILDEMAGGASSASVQGKGDIQLIGHDLDKALPEGAETPALLGGRGATDQRRYTPDQYVELWEEQHGRKMTADERDILEKGCIGITWVNVGAVPPLHNAYDTFEQSEAEMLRIRGVIAQSPDAPDGRGGVMGDYRVVMFAKMFFSNQQPHDPQKVPKDGEKSREENYDANMLANRAEQHQPDPGAFPVDAATGRVDMTKGWLDPATGEHQPYKYRNWRPEFRMNHQTGEYEDFKEDSDGDGDKEFGWHVNFDYGFWDEDSQCFWHANHAEPGMHVYQSSKEKFQNGYIDFDRAIYCVALTKVFEPAKAASNL